MQQKKKTIASKQIAKEAKVNIIPGFLGEVSEEEVVKIGNISSYASVENILL